MDPMGEEQLDYGEEEYGGSHKMQFQDGRGAIPALAEEEMMPEDDDYDDLYNDVNVGEGFIQTLQQQPASDAPPSAPFGNGLPGHNPDNRHGAESQDPRVAEQRSTSGFVPQVKVFEEGNANTVLGLAPEFRGAPPTPSLSGGDPKFATSGPSMMMDPGGSGIRGPPLMPPNPVGLMANRPVMNENIRPMVDINGPTVLYVGELHWWTTDAELESMASQYGRVKEIKFFDERASGKSKGYCQLEFYDPAAAATCKDGMNGHMFNGRACVVTFASAQTLRQMGASYMNKNQPQAQLQQQQHGRRPINDGMGGRGGGGMNFQGGDGGRRGGWGRGGQGFNNRNQGAGNGPMRGRGPPGAKGMMGPNGGVGAGSPYGQGLAGPPLGGPTGMMHPQSMLGSGFDPTYMNRAGPYGGFSTPAFPGMMPSFQAVNPGLHGVAPHVNPAFFGRGMSTNGMGLIGSSGMEGHSAGMWMDATMGGWAGDEHGRGTRESSYGGDDVASDYGYGEVNHERAGKSNVSREMERGSEREWSGNSERRQRDENERDRDRSDRERYREEKDGYKDHRQRDRDRDNDDNYDRAQSSSRSRSRMQDEDHRSRPRDADYVKRRRPSE